MPIEFVAPNFPGFSSRIGSPLAKPALPVFLGWETPALLEGGRSGPCYFIVILLPPNIRSRVTIALNSPAFGLGIV